jgi:hypothetical protein
MSQSSFLQFLMAVRGSPAMRARYSTRPLPDVIFQAKNDGFDFSAADVAEVIGRLEANVILNKDRDPFDGTARLWREMWGRRFIEYVIEGVVRRHTDDELRAIIERRDWGTA